MFSAAWSCHRNVEITKIKRRAVQRLGATALRARSPWALQLVWGTASNSYSDDLAVFKWKNKCKRILYEVHEVDKKKLKVIKGNEIMNKLSSLVSTMKKLHGVSFVNQCCRTWWWWWWCNHTCYGAQCSNKTRMIVLKGWETPLYASF